MGWFSLNPVTENPNKELYVIWWSEMSFCEISENGEISYQLDTSYEFGDMISYSSADKTVLLLGPITLLPGSSTVCTGNTSYSLICLLQCPSFL